ncbi:hypothetical protein POM88_000169 [Heracleum sosnowskyi]|uniref:Pentatricopeptide repeat-containing protein n=1 Tax=Heracleum sosnowskyi TaxID=360622 RepID=A0AAD8N8G3_9APIA|nr:hypothetical protein POM88_000169 [Heracleum sosnowskyi]
MKVFVKGADTSMFNVIDKYSNFHTTETKAHLHAFSSMGLRTLVVGKRELSSSKFEQWQSSYETASTAVMGRAALLRKVATNVENNLIILRSSGLRINCNKLLARRMTRIVINNRSEESCKKSLDDALTLLKKLPSVSGDTHNTGRSSEDGLGTTGLIIDGTSLVYILDTELEDQVPLTFTFTVSLKAHFFFFSVGLRKTGHTSIAVRLFRSMDMESCAPDAISYNTVIHCFYKHGYVDCALILLYEMTKKEISPNVITYNSLIHALFNLDRWADTRRLLREMVIRNISPDVYTYNVLINAYGKARKTKDAENVIKLMI